MNKKFLSLIFVLTLAGALLVGCAAPMQASAAPAQMEAPQQTVSEVSASVLADVENRSGATPAATQRCPVCGSDACTNNNCGRQYCDEENRVCREQKAACTGCGSYDCDGGQLCAGRNTQCDSGENAVRHQARHNTGHNGGHHGHHGE